MAEEKKGPGWEGFLSYAIAAMGIRWVLKLVGFIPSVEPITALALLASIKLGPWQGLAVGIIGYFGSNLLLLSNGMWDIAQAIGIGVPALWVGLNYFKKEVSPAQFVWIMIYSTLFFEVVVNLFFGESLGTFFDPASFVTALPFSILHIVSNIVIAVLVSGMLPKGKGKAKEEKEEKKE